MARFEMAIAELKNQLSSFLHRVRVGGNNPRAYDASRRRLDALVASWREIQPTESLRELVYVQLERFGIRAADALRLAAALIWCKQKAWGRLFVCNDLRLGDAARQVGFTVEAV